MGHLTVDGYGMIWDGKRAERTHRVSYKLHCGKIPKGKIVRHRCDVPSCVNPAHLEVGTQMQNIADREARKRTAVGAMCSKTKLTPEQVREIRASGENKLILMARFGVSEATIRHTRSRRYWKHIA